VGVFDIEPGWEGTVQALERCGVCSPVAISFGLCDIRQGLPPAADGACHRADGEAFASDATATPTGTATAAGGRCSLDQTTASRTDLFLLTFVVRVS
jgi:hypothetical protein